MHAQKKKGYDPFTRKFLSLTNQQAKRGGNSKEWTDMCGMYWFLTWIDSYVNEFESMESQVNIYI